MLCSLLSNSQWKRIGDLTKVQVARTGCNRAWNSKVMGGVTVWQATGWLFESSVGVLTPPIGIGEH